MESNERGASAVSAETISITDKLGGCKEELANKPLPMAKLFLGCFLFLKVMLFKALIIKHHLFIGDKDLSKNFQLAV